MGEDRNRGGRYLAKRFSFGLAEGADGFFGVSLRGKIEVRLGDVLE